MIVVVMNKTTLATTHSDVQIICKNKGALLETKKMDLSQNEGGPVFHSGKTTQEIVILQRFFQRCTVSATIIERKWVITKVR